MTSTERVKRAIRGEKTDRTPIYGWVFANLSEQITELYGSVEAFEDKYAFDAAHLFGGAFPYRQEQIEALKEKHGELTPDILLEEDFMVPVSEGDWESLRVSLAHHKARDRFCYVQTPGFFEHFNGIFGIENQLMYLLIYKEELAELYRRQAEWTVEFADVCIDMGVDCIHISDDWGAQNDLMFSPELWKELIRPNLKRIVDHVHDRGCLVSLHSDGCISKVTDDLAALGFDMLHPWQESAGMSYDLYLEKYADKFAILGGICVQTALGLLPRDQLEAEIRRVFSTLKGRRWVCCTTHFVQDHCSMEDLAFAFDLIYKLAREVSP
ncbi:MAG: hypothetical protein IJC35_08405 [Oscillospiraceae bacterium]|nr:hypothetical protein [Oscillospiraceae bacterium]